MVTSLIDATKDFIDKPYELGKMDCFRLIHDFLINRGCKPPVTFRGFDINTYAEFYLKDKDAALDLMLDYFRSFLEPIDPKCLFPGDIAILQYNFSDIFPGIVVANGGALVVTLEGVRTIMLEQCEIIGGFRCPQQ